MNQVRMRKVWMITLAALVALCASRSALAADADDPWPDLANNVFDGRPLADGTGT
jgi:hypothetical protein